MRYKSLILALAAVVACGVGTFQGVRAANPQLLSSVNGPGPGVIPSGASAGNSLGATGGQTAQISFQGIDGMKVSWDVSSIGLFDSEPLVTPGLQNFEMGKIYRLKIGNIANRAGLELYPTLRINSVTPRTRSYLEHNAIPVKFTDNDIDQVQTGNFVTKVIFLPSPEFQNIAVAGGVDTIVNTQLPAGADPVAEAQNRGAVLAVVQMGNKDLSLPGSYVGGGTVPGGEGGRVPQIPISGVNVPAFGTPNSVTPYGVPGPAVLPAAPRGVRSRLFYPVNPMPSVEVPENQNTWSGSQF